VPFADVKHQDAAIDRLQRGLRSDKVSHAYLFEGPEGVGKEMLAARFAQTLLCRQPVEVKSDGGKQIDACGQCDDCRIFAAGTHPDYHRVHRMLAKMHPDAEVRKRKATLLGVDVIRHFLIDQASHSPVRGRAQVFVVAESERMNDSAQNALLKTLEEPPGNSHLILLTTSAMGMLPTTRSRCQTVSFGPLPTTFVEERLVKHCKASPAAARFLAEYAEGRLGAAIRSHDAGLFEHVPEVLACVDLATEDPIAAAKRLAQLSKAIEDAHKKAESATKDAREDVADAGMDDADETEEIERPEDEDKDVNLARQSQSIVMGLLQTVLRDVLRMAAGAQAAALPREPLIRRLAEGSDARSVSKAIHAVASAARQIDSSINTGLMFDGVGIGLNRGLAPAPVGSGR